VIIVPPVSARELAMPYVVGVIAMVLLIAIIMVVRSM
jgi:hypothetical protein